MATRGDWQRLGDYTVRHFASWRLGNRPILTTATHERGCCNLLRCACGDMAVETPAVVADRATKSPWLLQPDYLEIRISGRPREMSKGNCEHVGDQVFDDAREAFRDIWFCSRCVTATTQRTATGS